MSVASTTGKTAQVASGSAVIFPSSKSEIAPGSGKVPFGTFGNLLKSAGKNVFTSGAAVTTRAQQVLIYSCFYLINLVSFFACLI